MEVTGPSVHEIEKVACEAQRPTEIARHEALSNCAMGDARTHEPLMPWCVVRSEPAAMGAVLFWIEKKFCGRNKHQQCCVRSVCGGADVCWLSHGRSCTAERSVVHLLKSSLLRRCGVYQEAPEHHRGCMPSSRGGQHRTGA